MIDYWVDLPKIEHKMFSPPPQIEFRCDLCWRWLPIAKKKSASGLKGVFAGIPSRVSFCTGCQSQLRYIPLDDKELKNRPRNPKAREYQERLLKRQVERLCLEGHSIYLVRNPQKPGSAIQMTGIEILELIPKVRILDRHHFLISFAPENTSTTMSQ